MWDISCIFSFGKLNLGFKLSGLGDQHRGARVCSGSGLKVSSF